MMQLGSDPELCRISGIFKSNNPEAFAKAIKLEATANYDKPEVLAEVSKGLGRGNERY